MTSRRLPQSSFEHASRLCQIVRLVNPLPKPFPFVNITVPLAEADGWNAQPALAVIPVIAVMPNSATGVKCFSQVVHGFG
jgi:hypothetical protein